MKRFNYLGKKKFQNHPHWSLTQVQIFLSNTQISLLGHLSRQKQERWRNHYPWFRYIKSWGERELLLENEMGISVCFENSFRKIYEDNILNAVDLSYSLKLGCNFKVCTFRATYSNYIQWNIAYSCVYLFYIPSKQTMRPISIIPFWRFSDSSFDFGDKS